MSTTDIVRDYYGRVLSTSADLKTSACCTPGAVPPGLRQALANVHDEVRAKYYGCGFVAPEALEGTRVLDLGCGAGQDVYVLAQMVGAKGRVTGVDMTPEQLAVASSHLEWHKKRFGYCCSNVTFVEGYIEELDQLGLEPGTFDVIVSNCVINLSPDKAAVLRGAKSLLKPGGEMYFADVYADRRLAESVRQDPVLLGECLGGALYWGDFMDVARSAGFSDPRLVTARAMTVDDPELARKCGAARFVSATYRLFNIDGLDARGEDYGQAVVYSGGIGGHDDVFALDAKTSFERGKAVPVSGNTFRTLTESRFSPHFRAIGDFNRHFGAFPGGAADSPFRDAPAGAFRAGIEATIPASVTQGGGGCC